MKINKNDTIKYKVIIEKKERKIVSIEKELSPFKNDEIDIFFDTEGKKQEFTYKKYYKIEFISNIPVDLLDYDNENVKMIIDKLFEGIPIETLELIYRIKFIK